MRRLKTKRIVWTLAVLIALSFVSALLLHKPEQPKIIGKLSPKDIEEISWLSLKAEREDLKSDIKASLQDRDFSNLIQSLHEYAFIKVSSLEALTSGEVVVEYQVGTNEYHSIYQAFRNESGWKMKQVIYY